MLLYYCLQASIKYSVLYLLCFQIFNVLQPIAESKVEDYRIRQVAYDSLLTFMPNVTFIQRMIFSSYHEPSQQMQSYISWVIDSLSHIEDPSYKLL